MATREEMKQEGIRRLQMLDIYKPYIRKFSSKATTPTFFENFGGFYADQEPDLMNKVKEIEANGKYLVYAITHEYIDGMRMWTFLLVSDDKDYREDEFEKLNVYDSCAFCWVENEDIPGFSEFGDSCFKSFGGGIKRITF
jgi:hypothetical protein